MKIFSLILVMAVASVGAAQTRTSTTTTNRSSSTATPASPAAADTTTTTDTAANPSYNTDTQNYSQTTVVEEKDSRISPGGLFIEPSLGYTRDETASRTGEIPLLSDTSGNLEGGSAGLRLGVHASEILFIAADGRYTRAEIDDSTYEKATGDMWNAGATLGLQMPIFGLRAWGTYVAAGQFDPAAGANGLDVLVKDGRGWRAGAGIRFKALSVNLEYQEITYDTTEVQAFGPIATNATTDIDFENKGYTLSLSFPIEL